MSIAIALASAACGAEALGSPAPGGAVIRGSAASCAGLTRAQRFDAAHQVIVGVMLGGPTVGGAEHGKLLSPARLRATGYLKGHGPRVVRVITAITRARGGYTEAEDGIEPRAGQRWVIYTGSRRMPFATSICGGSRRLARRRPPPGTTSR